MWIHDTRSGERLALKDPEDGPVGIYACGPTVYNRIHIGNARPFVVFSLLKRYLEHEGYAAKLVINVTDVNDKIYDRARSLDVPSSQLAAEMTAAYQADTSLLGLGRPDHEPLVTETIEPIVDLIQALIDNGAAYVSDGDVYFDVRRDAAYGSLSHRDLEQMDQGEAPDDIGRKRHPLDFALWKAEKPGEDTAWDAAWGRGRPGWHIECSAMAEQLLGVGFDIHGGGSDLVFPHHENEAAQTRCGRGDELAKIWMHNGMLQLGGEKMAKSVGNIELLHESVEKWGRDTLIWLFCTAHYRQPLQYTEEALRAARSRVRRVRALAARLTAGPADDDELRGRRDAFFTALANDFNTASALAEVAGWMNRATALLDAGHAVGDAELREMLDVLALANLLDAEEDEGSGPGPDDLALLDQRNAARAAKDWGEADRLRDELTARGWSVRDTADGAELVALEP